MCSVDPVFQPVILEGKAEYPRTGQHLPNCDLTEWETILQGSYASMEKYGKDLINFQLLKSMDMWKNIYVSRLLPQL